jgi:hypothetical protein
MALDAVEIKGGEPQGYEFQILEGSAFRWLLLASKLPRIAKASRDMQA